MCRLPQLVRVRLHAALLLSLLVCGLHSGPHAADLDPALQAALRVAAPDQPLAVIVRLRQQVEPRDFTSPMAGRTARRRALVHELQQISTHTQAALRVALREWKVPRAVPLWIVNGMALTATPPVIRRLAAWPTIQQLTLDATVTLPPTSRRTRMRAVPATGALWNLAAVQASHAWALGYLGQGVVIATLDTGVDLAHPALAGRWRGGTGGWFDPHGQHPTTPYDHDGHGTQVMGILVGETLADGRIGMAPGARWIAAKIFNDAGQATYSAIHQAFEWLLDPDRNLQTEDAPHVVNLSWGLDREVGKLVAEFQPDIRALKAAGIAVVCAAGNSGPGSSTSVSPANYPECLAVGSVDQTRQVDLSSSRGPTPAGAGYPQVVAPGVEILTADLTQGGLILNSYGQFNGTSFACPHVAGSLALLLSAYPQASVSQLEAAITQSAVDLGPAGADHSYGHGLLDISRALPCLRKLLNTAVGVPWHEMP